MVSRKLPAGEEPFQLFLSLGTNRMLVDVARHFDVHPSVVTRRAKRENWMARIAETEGVIAKRAEAEIVETLSEMRLRHAAVARDLIERGIEALAKFPIVELKDAIRAVELGVKMEREARELPTKSIEVTHQLRERLLPAEAREIDQPAKKIEITFDRPLEALLSPEDMDSVHRELDAAQVEIEDDERS